MASVFVSSGALDLTNGFPFAVDSVGQTIEVQNPGSNPAFQVVINLPGGGTGTYNGTFFFVGTAIRADSTIFSYIHNSPTLAYTLGFTGPTDVGTYFSVTGAARRQFLLQSGDTITGGALADVLYGDLGNDVITGGGGSDVVDGGPGTDRAVFSGPRSRYVIAAQANGGFSVTDQGGSDGADTLRSIEVLGFSDGFLDLQFIHAPVATPTAATQTVPVGQSVAVTSLFSTADADGDAIANYRFWDGGTGGGHFSVNGVTKAAQQNIDVSAADLANTFYVSGATPGTETLWVQLYDGTLWSQWVSWQEQTQRATNTLPVVSAPAVKNVLQNEWVRLSTILTVTDADLDPMVRFELVDGNAAAGSGVVWANGATQPQGATVTANTSSLADIWVRGGTGEGTDVIQIKAHDGFGFSDPVSFSLVTRLPNRAPVVTAANGSVTVNQGVPAGTLFTGSDPDAGDAIERYEFWDSGTAATSGHFTVNGVTRNANVAIPVSVAELAQTQYVGGSIVGTETVWVRANDGELWSPWLSWQMASARLNNAKPVVTINGSLRENFNEWIDASDARIDALIDTVDPDGDPVVGGEIRDLTPGGAHLWFNGRDNIPVNEVVSFTQADIAAGRLWSRGGTNQGTDQFQVRYTDGSLFSDWTSFDVVTRGPNRAPVATPTSANQLVPVGQAVAVSSLFSVSDPDGDEITMYRFWDSGSGGGYFSVGGVAKGAQQNIDVPAVLPILSDGFAGTAVNAANWHNPSYLADPGATFVGRTQFRVSENAALPAASSGSAIVKLETYNPFNGVIPSFYGTDLISNPLFPVGAGLDIKVRARMDGVTPGAVGGIFLYALTPGSNILHNEIDFELLGTAPNLVQTNIYSDEPLGAGHPSFVSYAGGTIADYHTYEIKWLAGEVSWYVDDVLIRTAASNVPDDPMYLHLNMWAPAAEWAEAYSADLQPTTDANANQTFSMSVDSVVVRQLNAPDFANTVYVGGATPGTETLWVQAYDGAAWSPWVSWQEQTLRANNVLPVVNAPAVKNVLQDEWVRLSSFITVTDADGDPMVRFELSDSNAGAGSGLMWFNATTQAQGATAAMANTSSLADLWVRGGANLGTDVITIRANDGYGFSDPVSFNLVTRLPNRAPVATPAALIQNMVQGAQVNASTLFGYSDADGDPAVKYEFWDGGTAATSGHFTLNGVTQAAGQALPVTAAQLAQTQYVGGSAAGTETVFVRPHDGTTFGPWAQWQMNTLA